jgi:hypothetical protein
MRARPAEGSIWRSGIVLAGAAQRLGHYGIRSLLILSSGGFPLSHAAR